MLEEEGMLSSSDSLIERFGLFVIIVLGEVVVGVVDGLSNAERDAETIATGVFALIIGFGLWWNYFDLTARRLPRADPGGAPIWLTAHFPLTLSIAVAGAAMVSVIEHATDDRTPDATAWLLAGSVSRPVPDLGGELEAAGLVVRSERRWLLGSLAVFEAGRAA